MDHPDAAGLGVGDSGDGKLIIFSSARPRHIRVSLVGDLDMTTAACLTNWAERIAVMQPRSVRLDASGLRFADVCGTRALTRACWLLHRRCRSFELIGLAEEARLVVELTSAELPPGGVVVTQSADGARRTGGGPLDSA